MRRIVFSLALAVAALFFTIPAFAANSDCLDCHSPSGTGLAIHKVDFTVAPVNRATACIRCHWEPFGAHPFHNQTWNCGACHTTWGSIDYTRIPLVSTGYGYFNTAASALTDANLLHVIHSSPRWPGSAALHDRQCVSCHATAACTACHQGALSPSHTDHTWDDAAGAYVAPYGPAEKDFGYGTTVGNEDERTVSSALTCSNTTCHDLTSGSFGPVTVDDGDPSLLFSPAGAWGFSSTSGYIGNTYRRSNAPGARATLTFTGERVAFISDLHPYRGMARIYIDGVATATVDLYSASIEKQYVAYTSPTLSAGSHTISVEVIREKNAASRDYYVAIDAFLVYPRLVTDVTDCTTCHPDRAVTHGYNSYDHVADVTNTVEPGGTSTCGECHSMDLMTEHSKPTSSGPHDCTTCHPKPQDTIGTSWDQTCVTGGCHTAGSVDASGNTIAKHHAMAYGHRWNDAAACAKNCHGSDLAQTHTFAGVSCVQCHTSAKFASLPGHDTGGVCTPCHPTMHTNLSETGNNQCFSCHGSSTTTMSIVASGGAYANTGGDHSAGFGASAHGSSVPAGNLNGVQTGIQCEACHSKRSATATGAIDYRMNGGDPAADQQSGLCYHCHSRSGEETLSAGVRPYDWNQRDVKAEFALTSHHAVDAEPPNTYSVPETLTAFIQGTPAEFSADTILHAQVATLGVSIIATSWPESYSPKQLLFAGQWSGILNQYDPATGQWNSMGYDPPDLAGSAISGMFTVGGNIYVKGFQNGTGYISVCRYSPADGSTTGTWTGGPGIGYWTPGQAEDEAHDAVYLTASNYISVYRPSTNSNAGTIMIKNEGGAAQYQSYGTATAYSPQADKLFLVNRNGNSVTDGHLYSYAAPSQMASNWHDTGIQITCMAGWYDESAMTRFTVGGRDYLILLGENPSTGWESRVLTGLDSTPTVLSGLTAWPFGNGGQGLHVTWDGSRYLYASNDYGGVHIARIRIPDDPTGPWGSWESIDGWPSPSDWVYLGVATATPLPRTAWGFEPAGSVSADVDAPPLSRTWGVLTWNGTGSSATTITVGVQGWNGSGWVPLAGYASLSGGTADLTGISAVTYPRLRLTAQLVTGDRTVTPTLTQWSLTAVRAQNIVGVMNDVRTGAMLQEFATGSLESSVVYSTDFTGPQVWAWYYTVRTQLYAFNGLNLDRYDPKYDNWNANGLKPGNPTRLTAQGGAAFAFGNSIYWPRNYGASFTMPMAQYGTYLVNNSVWESSTAGSLAATVSGDAAVDATHGVAYMLGVPTPNGFQPVNIGGSSSNPTVLVNSPRGGYVNCSAGTYAPATDKLFFVDHSGGTGRLFSVSNPYSRVTSVLASDTGVQAADLGCRARVGRATIGGSDYLLDWTTRSGTPGFYVIGDLNSASPTIVPLGKPAPFANTWPGPVSEVEWDGDSYFYITDPGGTGFARIRVPSTPMVASAWGDWQTLTPCPSVVASGAWATDSKLVAAPTTLAANYANGFSTATVDTGEIAADPGSPAWSWMSWDSNIASLSVSIRIDGYSGGTWSTIPGFDNVTTSPVDLRTLPTSTYPKIRAHAVLVPSNYDVPTTLSNWKVTSGNDVEHVTSWDISANPGAASWDFATWSIIRPAGSSVSVAIQGWKNGSWNDIPGFTGLSGSFADISTLQTAEYPKLRFQATLMGTTFNGRPRILSWWAATRLRQLESAGSLTCVSCHNPHLVKKGGSTEWDLARVSDPTNTKLDFTATISPTTTKFCLACHDGSNTVARATTSTIVPYTLVFPYVPDTAFFAGWNKADPSAAFTSSAHFTNPNTKALCENCHDPHGSNNARLTAWTRPSSFTSGFPGTRDNTSPAAFEENLCYQCHGNGTTRGRKALGAPDVATPMSMAYTHPVDRAGMHRDVESAAALGANNRHSECVDCHDPHAARSGIHQFGSSTAGGALIGAVGAKPNWRGGNWTAPASYTSYRITGATPDVEAYLCFKCHSSNTTLPTTGGYRGQGGSDLALEFNPANQSLHNVLGLDRDVQTTYTVYGTGYTWRFFNDLKVPYTPSTKLTCTSCHTNGSTGAARGPHGSSTPFMIDPNYSGDWQTARYTKDTLHVPYVISPANLICTKCHDLTNMDNGVHTQGGVHGTYCVDCHIRIPHGWKRPRLLGYESDPAPYGPTRILGITLRSHTGGWSSNDCAADCGGYGHGTYVGAVWP